MDVVVVEDAALPHAADIARIGAAAMRAQYASLVDPRAIDAAVAQIYSREAVAHSIDACSTADSAEFLVARHKEDTLGFLHFDAFGQEPELHRLYVDKGHRGAGVGGLLMDELHARLRKDCHYMLLVLAGNDRAVSFYQRQGLHVAERVDGLRYYHERMGVIFPPGTEPFELILMRRQ